jgi:hypothetical protein
VLLCIGGFQESAKRMCSSVSTVAEGPPNLLIRQDTAESVQ